jgi:hypothetical protein
MELRRIRFSGGGVLREEAAHQAVGDIKSNLNIILFFVSIYRPVAFIPCRVQQFAFSKITGFLYIMAELLFITQNKIDNSLFLYAKA